MLIVTVLNYDWWPTRVKSNLFWGFYSWIEYMEYPVKIFQKTKVLFLVWPLGGFFLAFRLGLLESGFSLLVLHFFSCKVSCCTLIHLIPTLSSLEILCKNKPPRIKTIYEAKKRLAQNPSGGFFTFCKINMYRLECLRCLCHDILSRIFLTLLPSGWYFSGLRIMFRHPCTQQEVNIRMYFG